MVIASFALAQRAHVELAEVDGSADDDGTADNHCDCAGELAAATLHTVLDGHAEVDEAEYGEYAAEERYAVGEHFDNFLQHSEILPFC